MKRFTIDAAVGAPDTAPIFIGSVLRQELVTSAHAASQRVTAVTFQDGARNRWHRHTTEQVLIVTAGHGIIATDETEIEVEVGDVVLIEPNERHWHGARSGQDMTHLSVLLPGQLTIDEGGVTEDASR